MAESIKPYVPQRGRFKPYIPPTLQDDYKQFL